VYRTSGVFPGMQESYQGHERIAVFWHHSNEPWEWFEIEPRRTVVVGDRVIADVGFRGRGAGSGADVAVDAGHLVTFRDGLIVEFCAFGSFEEAMAAVKDDR
jgi:ketosteroid isomerase-like protein